MMKRATLYLNDPDGLKDNTHFFINSKHAGAIIDNLEEIHKMLKSAIDRKDSDVKQAAYIANALAPIESLCDHIEANNIIPIYLALKEELEKYHEQI